MKDRGFTLIELLAIIILLAAVVLILFPNIISITEKKNNEIDDATLQILYSSADQYIKDNRNEYENEIGNIYCIEIQDMDDENIIPIDVSKYLDQGIQVKIGTPNSYKLTVCDKKK